MAMERDSDLPGQHEILASKRAAALGRTLGATVMSGDFEAPWGEGSNREGETYARAFDVGSASVDLTGTKIVPVLTDEIREKIEREIDSTPPGYV